MKRTWKRCAVLAALIAALSAGTAWAAPYDDQLDGNWNDVNVWGGAAYPVVGDTATIDSNVVTVNINLQDADQPDLITLATGGTLRVAGGNREIYAPIDVTSDAIIRKDQASWNTESIRFRGDISGAGKITFMGAYARYDLYGTNTGFSGGFDLTEGNMWFRADGAWGTGPVTLAGYAQNNVAQTGTTPGVDAPSSVTVNSGGTLDLRSNANWAMTMNDGSELQLSAERDVGADSTITASGTVTINCNQGNETNYYLGDISGSGKLILTCTSNGGNGLGIGGDNSGYTGDIDIVAAGTGQGRVVYILSDNALGTDTAGGTVTLVSHRMGLNADLARSFTMNEGTTVGMFGSNNTTRILGGTITLAGDADFYISTNSNQNPKMQVDGQVTGAGKLTLEGGATSSHASWDLNNAANDFAGGLVVDCNANPRGNFNVIATVNAAEALSSGDVTVLGGTLATTVDGALDSPSVIDVVGGTLELGSTETAQFSLQQGALLKIAGGSTALDYTPTTGNVQVFNNAVLDKASIVDAALATPTLGQIQGAAAQNQVLQGLTSNWTDEAWFGPGAGGNGGGSGEIIWGGLATGDRAVSVTGTIHEYTAGGGLSFGSQKGRELTLDGSVDATGDIDLVGGSFRINGGAIVDQAGTINMNGAGRLYLSGTDALPAQKVLEVNNGWVAPSAADSMAAGSTVNVNAGGVFQATIQPAAGNGGVTVNSGGGVYVTAADALDNGNFSFQPGSQLCLDQNNVTSLPTTGDVDFLIADGKRTITENIVLGDNTRLASAAAPPVSYPGPWNYLETGGQVTTVGTQGRIAVMADTSVDFRKEISFPGATLIINDANPWTAMDSYGTGYDEITYSGRIIMRNAANQCDTLRIEAGTVTGYGWANYGDPDSVYIAAGAVLNPNHGNDDTYVVPDATISGDGLFEPVNQARNLRFDASTFSPGDGVGVLTINNGTQPTQLGKVTIGGTGTPEDPYVYDYTTFDMEVASDGGVAGTDHDQVVFLGGGVGRYSNTLDNADLVVALPLPGPDLVPATPNWSTPDPDDVVVGNLGAMVIVSAPEGAVSGTLAATSVGATLGVDADPGTPGVQPDYHWMVATGADPVTYTANQVVLEGADILWMGMPGDANLDDSCDVSDLSLLAGNYRKSGTWLQGDFNFDGNVDVSDLSLLAGNFRTSNPYFAPGSGGSPVPEPVTLVLLGLGGIGLVARRRRK